MLKRSMGMACRDRHGRYRYHTIRFEAQLMVISGLNWQFFSLSARTAPSMAIRSIEPTNRGRLFPAKSEVQGEPLDPHIGLALAAMKLKRSMFPDKLGRQT